MNEREGRSESDGERLRRAKAPTSGPAQERKPGSEPAGPGSGQGSVVEPTIGLDPTEGFVPEPTMSAAKSKDSKETVLLPAAKPLAPKDGEVIAGRFLVRRLLGQGGMGRVYAVQDKHIEGRDVALKVLLPKYSKNAEYRKLFFQEVRAAQGFVSEYICQVRDTGETEDGSLFLTMDLIEGESLRALLDRDKVLGARHALEITRQVLLGLQSGHEKGFVHRDIKPPNVMLSSSVPKTDDNPFGVGSRLLDFGIAGLASKIDERSRAGTIMYMSPEQASGERLDARSDLFAVGVMLFEMLSGHRPFEGTTTRALVQSVLETNLTERLIEIPNLSKQVRKLLVRALQKDRDKRFQSANEFAETIERSSAYKLPKEVPGWAYAGLAILGVASIGEALVLFGGAEAKSQGAEELRQLKLEAAAFPGKLSRAQQEIEASKNKELQSKQEELQGKQNEFNATSEALTKLTEEYRRASVDLEKTHVDNAELNRKLGAASQTTVDAAQIQAQIDESQKPLNFRITDLENQKKDAEAKIEALQKQSDLFAKENSDLKLQLKPEGRKAETFDKVLTAVEEGRGDTALVQLTDAARAYSIFLNQELDGVAFLTSLATASAELRKHTQGIEREHRPDMGAVTRALAAYSLCQESFVSFPSQTKDWIKFKLADLPTQDRLERAKKALARLGQSLANVRDVADKAHADAWASLGVNAAVDDPAAVFAHADSYGCTEHIAKAAEHLVDVLRSDASPDGTLDFERLNHYPSLGEWVKRLDTAHFPLEISKEIDLRLFDFAQRWYDADTTNDSFDWKRIALPPLTEPTTNWKYVLQLQHALTQPGSGYPIHFHGHALYHQIDEHGVVSWIEDKDNRERDDPKNWEILHHFADADGQFSPESSTLSLERVDETIRVKGGNSIYLEFKAHGPQFHVEPLPPLSNAVIPHSLLSAQQLDAFKKTYASQGSMLCLVVTDGLTTRWLSPRFGLVREKILGGWTRDLVYWLGAP